MTHKMEKVNSIFQNIGPSNLSSFTNERILRRIFALLKYPMYRDLYLTKLCLEIYFCFP